MTDSDGSGTSVMLATLGSHSANDSGQSTGENMPKLGNCKDCNQAEMLGGRGLCKACYSYHHNHHSLNNFPRSTWKREDLLAEWDFWRVRGHGVRDAAEKIGVTASALRKALERTRKLTIDTTALWDQGLQGRKIN